MILSESYIVMEKTRDDDYEICFFEDGSNLQMAFSSLEDAKECIKQVEGNFDNPLVIIRETQTII